MTTTTDDRGPNARYQMFSREGNDRCAQLVRRIVARVEAGQITRVTLPQAVRDECKAMEREGFGEVFDTEPQGQIAWELTKRVCEPNMWQELDRWEW